MTARDLPRPIRGRFYFRSNPNGSLIHCVVGILIVVSACASTFGAPIQWRSTDGGNGHFYEAVHVGPFTTWFEADAIAVARGGYLVTLTSAAENEFVYGLIKDRPDLWTQSTINNALGPWTGGIQDPAGGEPDEGWGWITGEPMIYQNWYSGFGASPNEGEGGLSDYIHFFNASPALEGPFWNDVAPAIGWDIRGFVVEFVPEPATWVILVFGAIFLGHRHRVPRSLRM
jgi:hypothetical protein